MADDGARLRRHRLLESALDLLAQLWDVKRCLAAPASHAAAPGSDVIAGVRVCRSSAASDGQHLKCLGIPHAGMAMEQESWWAVGRQLAAVELWESLTTSTAPAATVGKAGRIRKAFVQWTRASGRTLENVTVTEDAARRLRNVDEDGRVSTVVPFIRYQAPSAHAGKAGGMAAEYNRLYTQWIKQQWKVRSARCWGCTVVPAASCWRCCDVLRRRVTCSSLSLSLSPLPLPVAVLALLILILILILLMRL
jgi:hypothetical protein